MVAHFRSRAPERPWGTKSFFLEPPDEGWPDRGLPWARSAPLQREHPWEAGRTGSEDDGMAALDPANLYPNLQWLVAIVVGVSQVSSLEETFEEGAGY